MVPPIETITDRVEMARRINKCIDDQVYFAEQFLDYDDIFFYNKEFLKCNDRFIVARYGRQSGKSKNVGVKALHFGYFLPMTAPHLKKEKNVTVLCVSQSEDQAGIIFSSILSWVERSNIISSKIVRQTKTELWIKSFDDNHVIRYIVRPTGESGKSVRGYTAALIIIDEAQYVPALVYNALLPAGSAVKARVYALSTPAEKAGVFYEICNSSHTIYKMTDGKYGPVSLHKKDTEFVWTQFHISSWDNPNNKKDPIFLNLVKKMSKTKQKAELEAEFLDAGASLISHELLDDAFTNVKIDGKIDYVDLGVDTSGKGEDETVLIDIIVMKDGRCFPAEVYTEETTDQTLLAKEIERRYRSKRYRHIYLDSTGLGDGLVDACRHVKTTLPLYPVDFKKEKVEIYNNLVIVFENRNINFTKFPDEHRAKCRQQLQYLYAEYGLHKDAGVKIRTHDDHDDFPDALALGCFSVMNRGEWKELPADIVDPDLAPMVQQEEEKKEPIYWLGNLRLN